MSSPDDQLVLPPAPGTGNDVVPPLPWEENSFVPAPQGTDQPLIPTPGEAVQPAPVYPQPPLTTDEEAAFLEAMNAPAPVGAFGLQPVDLGSSSLTRPGAKAETKAPWLATPESQAVGDFAAELGSEQQADASTLFSQQYGARPDLDEDIDQQLAGPLQAPTAPESVPLEQMAPEEEATFMVNRGPRYVATVDAIRKAEAEKHFADREHEELKRDADARQRSFEVFQRASTDLMRERQALRDEAKRLASQDVDPDRWWASRSTGQQVALAISAGLGGFLNPGGRNSTIEMIEGAINRDIDAQKATLAGRRDLIGQQQGILAEISAQTGDEYRATEAVRLAAMQNVRLKIAQERLRYDPRGTQAQHLANFQVAWEQAEAAALAKADAELHKRGMEAAKHELDVRKQAEDERHNRYSERNTSYATSVTARGQLLDGAKANRLWNPKTRRWEVDPTAPVNEKDQLELRRLRAQADKDEADARLAQSNAGGGPGGDPNAVGGPDGTAYRNKDGSTFAIKDEFRRKRISELNVANQNIRRMADLVAIMRADKGGASSKIGSDEYQELASLAAQTDFETYKAFGLGAPSAGDTQMAANARGGKDITSFIHDPSAGFQAYADGIEKKLNTEMRDAGYTGAPVKAPRIERAAAVERTKDDNAAIITQPIPPHARTDEASRARYVEAKATAAAVALKHQNPSAAELKAWARKLDDLVEAGQLTREEAIGIVAPMATKVAQAEQRRIQDTPDSKLRELQSDESYMQRASLLLLVKSGKATPEQVYELVVGGE